MSDTWMGSLAAQDAYSPDEGAANAALWRDPNEVAAARLRGPYNRTQPNSSFGDTALVWDPPPPRDPAQPFKLSAAPEDIDKAINAALSVSGGGLATRVKNPALYHGVSDFKLERPIAEVPRDRLVIDPQATKERLISPESLQGEVLMPVMGDTAAAGHAVTHVGGERLPEPVDLKGGHGFMSQDPDYIWASKQGNITGLANNVRKVSEQTGKPVELVYSAMSPQALDFNTFMSDALAQQMKTAPVSKKAAVDFNERVAKGNVSFKPVRDFPGVTHDDLQQWLFNQPGNVRDTIAKAMDKSAFRKEGFPNVGETRHAIMDDRLINAKLGDAGLSIARPDPAGISGPSSHPTYSTGLKGSYTGGLGTSVPFNVMFPDLAAHYAKTYPTTRFDKLATSLAGDVKYQDANQQWLDGIMRYLEGRRR